MYFVIVTYAYRDHNTPVRKIAICIFAEMCSAGFSKSRMFEKVIAHLKEGAQKKTIYAENNIRLLVLPIT